MDVEKSYKKKTLIISIRVRENSYCPNVIAGYSSTHFFFKHRFFPSRRIYIYIRIPELISPRNAPFPAARE